MDQPDATPQTFPHSHGEATTAVIEANDKTQLSQPLDLIEVEKQETEYHKNSHNSSPQDVVEVGHSEQVHSNIVNVGDEGGKSIQLEPQTQIDISLSTIAKENNSVSHINTNEALIPESQNSQEKSSTCHIASAENPTQSEFQCKSLSHDQMTENKDLDSTHSQSHSSMTYMDHTDMGDGPSIIEKTMAVDESLNHPSSSDGILQHDFPDLSQESSTQVCEVPDKDLENVSSVTPVLKINDSRFDNSSNTVVECLAMASACFQEQSVGNFLKGCKWSPDGNQIMTNSNDNHLRIFTPQEQLSQGYNNMDPTCVIREKSQIYDFCWYPAMSSSVPDSCRLVSACSGIPIHMWDSNDGKIISHYLAYDHCDEIIAAYSLSFSPLGSKLFAGYKKAIRIFDTERPGRACRILKTYNSSTKEGVRGIISCFAFSQDANPVFVAGSYSRDVGVYDYASEQLIYMMQGQQGGVTHVALSPDGTKLYTGGRKDPEIVCWDMRNTGQVLFSCLRDVQTNQRIYFDLSESGQYLVSGNHDGSVLMWNTLDPGENIGGEVIVKPCFSFLAHQDCVNGVSFNHQQNVLATSSGQRHFMDFDDYDSDSSSMSVDNTTESTVDYSLKLWKIPSCSTNISI